MPDSKKKLFDSFTNQYSLSKTLRFELKPIEGTLENMRKHLQFDEELKTFLVDQKIENAYLLLKPVFDYLHEEFITESLESSSVLQLDFSAYLAQFRNRKTSKDKDFEFIEKELRDAFEGAYIETAERLKLKAGQDKKGKNILSESGCKVLTEKGILTYIKKNISEFTKIRSEKDIKMALEAFDGFFTYFTGFNQNRENYYETKKESATAVATRIVHENLPRFCDNALFFEEHLSEYTNIYSFLQTLGRNLVDKEGRSLTHIATDIFNIAHYNLCLSQQQIDEYNDKIGNANFLINLYRQARQEQDTAVKIPLFKTLYKQIGCGKRELHFFAITHDRASEALKAREKNQTNTFSVEEVLQLANEAGKKYFESKSDDGSVNTIPEFLDYIKTRENYLGIYWSKSAINTISAKYFSNWEILKELLKQAKIFSKADKSSDDDVKIPEAVELEGFFYVLDQVQDWREDLFKESLKRDEEKAKIIAGSLTASQALLALICTDIERHRLAFLEDSTKILLLEKYQVSENKEVIKNWMDHALSVNQILKYFSVKEGRVKGSAFDSVISQALKIFFYSEDIAWFRWYDALRNYLTKKSYDDVKENMLKLNFENSSLLGGWSDGQEKTKASVLLKKDKVYYLGILKKKSLFDTSKKDNPMYKQTDAQTGRLILANLKFQTLAGKGFKGKFGKSYGEIGRQDPMRAVELLKQIIVERYVDKYPLLQEILDTSYSLKKDFDKDIQRVLANSYVCDFTPIDWNQVVGATNKGDMYLFQIYTKDFSGHSSGKKDLQTLYWDTVLQSGSPFQLNGGGEIFYRKQGIQDKDKKSKIGYEKKSFILDKKRFTAEKFLFHCPIKLNYAALGSANPKFALSQVNKKINEKLLQHQDIHFLGIDRGEKHLAYYSLIDKNGVIKKQGTLNVPFLDVAGNGRVVMAEKRVLDQAKKEQIEIVECHDYNDLLAARAGDRDYARKNWQTISKIKDLKEGYISQVVKIVADLAVENNAFIVLEDLDTGFKRGRQKIEKSVYQKFELALAKKLNFLVDKGSELGSPGSVTNAFQLTPPVTNYGDIEGRKQVGIMLYTRADYTSQTDPITGWRRSIYLKRGSETYIKSQVVTRFSDIGFDGSDYFFTYEDISTHKLWTLYTGKSGQSLDRYQREKGSGKDAWRPVKKDLRVMLDGLFENFDKQHSLREQILEDIELKKIDPLRTAWESLRFTIELLQQIRNTGINENDNDFLLSPVRDSRGNHFDSRVATESQPNSGDANGAYNIARKGIIMHEHLKRGVYPLVKDIEWDAWLAGDKSYQEYLAKLKH